MSRQAAIVDKLQEALHPLVLEVINESDTHNVPRGSETHFKVVVVSKSFEGLGPVDRHRLVNTALADLLQGGVHALAITSRTPSEWATANGSRVAESPECLGGSNAKS